MLKQSLINGFSSLKCSKRGEECTKLKPTNAKRQSNLQNCCKSLILKTLMAFENADDICVCLFDAQRPNLDKTRTLILLLSFSVASPVLKGLVLVQ